MTVCFNIDSNTRPDIFTVPGFDTYTQITPFERSAYEQLLLLNPTATINQLHNAYFTIKPMACDLTTSHLQDLTRTHHYSVFDNDKPTLATLKKLLLSTSNPLRIALGNMFKAGLFSQNTFLFSLKQSIDTRILQLEKERSRVFPVGLPDAKPSIIICDLQRDSFTISYTNSIGYREYMSEDAAQGCRVKFSGDFILEVRFKLVPPSPEHNRFINKYNYSFPYNIPYISRPNPYPVLQAVITCAEYYVEPQYTYELQRLGFEQQRFYTPLSSCPSSRSSMISPNSLQVGRTLSAAAKQLSTPSDCFAKLPSSLPASQPNSRTPSRTVSREPPCNA